ncbi:MAG: NAD(P)-dependent oxidoreductase, partial [Rubrobacter sp.]|nr:NAD(P)-dependent oxidoreductase [Rubrobacter sp.]
TVEEFRPVLEAMGSKVFHLGPRGSGSRMKLVNNLVAAANLAALSEGLALGEAAGIPAEKQLEVFMTGAAASRLAELKGEKVSTRSHDPQFKLSHMVKDLRYALDLGYGLEQALPLTALVSQVYTAGLREHGDDDISAVSEVSRRSPR